MFIRGQNAIAFTAFGANPVGHVYRVNVDGGNLQQLTKAAGENLVGVSPDGVLML